MTNATGRLIITIIDAKNLNSDQYGRVDPYCQVTLPGLLIDETFKTKAYKKGGKDPVWEESHVFKLSKEKLDTKLKFALYDNDVFKDEYLGAAEVTLSELLENKGKVHYYDLVEKRPDQRVAGSIGIVSEFDDHETKADLTQAQEVSTQKAQCKCAPGECRCTGDCACKKAETQQMQPIVDASKPLNGLLTITVVDAKDLSSDQYGRMDPYCKIILPGVLINETFQTKEYKKGGTTPLWEESHSFKLSKVKLDTKLNFALYDKDVFKHEYLGSADIYLSELMANKGKIHYYELYEKRPDHPIAGHLGLRTEFDDHDLKEDLTHIKEKMQHMSVTQKDQCQCAPGECHCTGDCLCTKKKGINEQKSVPTSHL